MLRRLKGYGQTSCLDRLYYGLVELGYRPRVPEVRASGKLPEPYLSWFDPARGGPTVIRFTAEKLWFIRREDLRSLADLPGGCTEDDGDRRHNVSFPMRDEHVPAILEGARRLKRPADAQAIVPTPRTMLPLPLSGAVFSSQLLVATESLRGHSLRIWDAVTGEKKATIKEHRDSLEGTAFSPDGTLLATSSNGQTARIWDAATGSARATLTGHQGIVWRVAFSPDSTLLATVGMGESTVRIWDTSTGAARARLTDSVSPTQDVAFSPDNTLLATASGSTARVWDIATGALRASLRGHTSAIMAVVFSPDGTLLATGSIDETARIWEAATGAVRAILTGHRESARRVAFSPDSTLLAIMDNHCMLRIWDAGVGTSRATRTGPIWGAALTPYGKLRTFGYDVASILATTKYYSDGMAFSPDGALLAAFGDSNAVRIWDAVTGAHRITLKNHTGIPRAMAFIAGSP